MSADVYALPSGATFNLQENHIDWLPRIAAGEVLEFTLPVTAQAADVLAPEQDVVAFLRHQGVERQTAARVWLGIVPLVGEVQAQSQVAVGQPVRLRAEVAGPGPIETVWDLGDGRRLDLAEPEVVYPAAGQYTITIEASNPGGQVVRQSILTVLPNPVAAFRPEDESPAIGQAVTFANTSGGQPPLSVFWDFGDGNTLVGEQQPVHVYDQAGVYRVRLAVENAFGRSEAVWDVTVGNPPTADLIIPEQAAVGQPVIGEAVGDASVTRYQWDMGDGRGHEGSQISHIYRRPGDYYVSVMADNGHGQVSAGRWIHVEAGTSTFYLPLAAHQIEDNFAGLSADAPPAVELDPAAATLAGVFALDPIPFPAGTTPAEQLYAYLNAARARFQLPPVAYGFELSAAAQAHALDKSLFPDNPHIGSDGTTAAERLLRSGYRGGYAGESTAWGFSDPRLAVEFWINSETHRPLLLNRLATDVGVGYVEDHTSANVWHWTAEFGVSYGAPTRAVLRAQSPAVGYSALDTEVVNYSWMWPLPLSTGQQFTVYLSTSGQLVAIGSIDQPVYGSRYILSADARALRERAPLATSGEYAWLVRLTDSQGQVIAESESRLVAIAPDPTIVEATVAPTPVMVTATAPAPTVTPTATPQPTDEPPSGEPPPVIVTATPQPTP
jgi:PKD repeat protein